jgi:hypothetical protein
LHCVVVVGAAITAAVLLKLYIQDGVASALHARFL